MTQPRPTWTDPDGDRWYEVSTGQWSMWHGSEPLAERQPPSIGNVSLAGMREFFGDKFPY